MTGDWVEIADVHVPADSVFAGVDAAIADLAAADLRPADAATAANLTKVIEHLARKVHGVALTVMDQIDRDGLHRADGHGSVAIHARHTADLSNAEAQNRQKSMRMLRDLPLIRDAFLAGDLSIDKAQLLARVHANPRVTAVMAGRQERFLDQATRRQIGAYPRPALRGWCGVQPSARRRAARASSRSRS